MTAKALNDRPPTVYVIDDDANVTKVITGFLAQAGYAVRSYLAARPFLEEVRPESSGCIVLDYRMPEMDGLELQRELTARGIGMPVLFLTGIGSLDVGIQAMKNGAHDFLVKPVNSVQLLQAVADALAIDAERATARKQRATLAARLARLTPRECQVFDLVVRGLSNRDVGAQLHIAEKTVKVHRARVMAKMQARSLPELVLAAQRLGRV